MNNKPNHVFKKLTLPLMASMLCPMESALAQPTACSVSADNLTTTCSASTPITQTSPTPNSIGTSGPTPLVPINAISVYDASAGQYPLNNAGNGYTPTHWLMNPPTVTVNILSGTTFSFTNPLTAQLADKGIIGANFSNSENPAVNNWTLNNAGSINLITNLFTSRLQTIISDSQVNQFTVNNTGTLSATQTYWSGGTVFNSALLSNTAAGSPPTNTAKYNGSTLNVISAVYTDDNTNALTLNNSGTINATGNFTAGIYGRAGEQNLNNTGTIANTSWTPSDAFYQGHWSIANYGGAEFATVNGSNPDNPIYQISGSPGSYQVSIDQTGQTNITNTNTGTIKGDILVLDASPLTMAAALARGQTLPIANSGSNSGPRDSNISNDGLIQGNLYLGSGQHVLTNSGSIQGSINVDQSPSLGVFLRGTPGTVPGTFASNGGSGCPAAGGNTTDPNCAQTTNVQAYFAGSRTLSLVDSGSITGSVNVTNTTADSQINIAATGIQGNLNVTGSATANQVTLRPYIASTQIVHNNSNFTIANSTTGSGNLLANRAFLNDVASNSSTPLLNWTPSTNGSGNLVYTSVVPNANTLPGIGAAGANAINAVLAYTGANTSIGQLGNQLQSISSATAAAQTGDQLAPSTNNTNFETIFNVTNNLERIIDNHMTEGHMAGFMGIDYNPVNHNSPVAKGYGVTPGFWLEGIKMSQNQGTYGGVSGYGGTLSGFAVGLDTHLGESSQVLSSQPHKAP